MLSTAHADGPQTNDVLGGKVIGLRGWPVVPVNPTDGQGLFWSKALNAYAPGGFTGVAGQPGGAVGSIQINSGSGSFGGLVPASTDFSTINGTLSFASGAACFNIGPLGGDLSNTICNNPRIAPGASSRNVGNLGVALQGTLPNPTFNIPELFSEMGAPGGDLGGTSYQNPIVDGLNGFPLCAGQQPIAQSALVWNGSCYTPVVQSPGITQLTGQGIAGPGTGAQVFTLAANSVTNQQLLNAPAVTLKCNAGATSASLQDCPVTGGLAFAQGALQLSPTLGISNSQTLSDGTNKFCYLFTNGIATSFSSGACTTGTINLTADDGATTLTADDGATLLTADGSAPTTPCNNAKYAFNVACNATVWSLFRSAF